MYYKFKCTACSLADRIFCLSSRSLWFLYVSDLIQGHVDLSCIYVVYVPTWCCCSPVEQHVHTQTKAPVKKLPQHVMIYSPRNVFKWVALICPVEQSSTEGYLNGSPLSFNRPCLTASPTWPPWLVLACCMYWCLRSMLWFLFHLETV